MEMSRLVVLYIHLIACCTAIGLVLTSDIATIRKLFKSDPGRSDNIRHLHYLQRVVSWSLITLWVSGVAIISLDASVKGLEYFANPKLQSKIAVVLILTFNGFLLHASVMPNIERFGSMLKLPINQRIFALVVGSVSGVSWFYAAMLGVGRSLSWKYSLFELMVFYPILIAGGFVALWGLTTWAQKKKSYEPFSASSLSSSYMYPITSGL